VHLHKLWIHEAVQISVQFEVVSKVSVASSEAEAEAAWLVGNKNKAAKTPCADPEKLSGHDSKRDTKASYRTGKNEKDALF